jgi:hypothetical protein
MLTLKFLLQVLRLAGFSALCAAVILAHTPAALPELPTKGNAKAVELTDSLKQAAIKGTGVLEIGQDELNRHLQRELQVKPAATQAWSQTQQPRIELLPGRCRVHLHWQLGPLNRTAAIDLAVSRLAHAYRIEVLGGAYGKLELPRALMRPLQPVLEQLRQSLQPEIAALFQMHGIEIARGKLILDPHIP